MDMHSGGGAKEDYEYIYIEAPEQEAKVIFYNRFGHSPDRVSCTCCGEDYSTSERESLEDLTGYERRGRFAYFKGNDEVEEDEAWKYGKGMAEGYTSRYVDCEIPLSEYVNSKGVLVIKSQDIKDEERAGSVPEQGYVWVD